MPFDSNYNNIEKSYNGRDYMDPIPQPVFYNGNYRSQGEINRLEQENKIGSGDGRARVNVGNRTPSPPKYNYQKEAVRSQTEWNTKHGYGKKDIDELTDEDYDSSGELTGNGVKKILRKVRKWARRRGAQNDSSDDSSDDDDYNSDGEITGKGIRKKFRKVAKKAKKLESELKKSEVGKAIVKTAYKVGDEIKKEARPKGVLGQMASEALNQAPGVIGDAVGAAVLAVSGNPILAEQISSGVEKGADIGRDVMKEKTGYGKKMNMSKVIEKYVKEENKTDKPKRTRKVSERNILVKKVMKEQGLSLAKASQYIKENNLYTPPK